MTKKSAVSTAAVALVAMAAVYFLGTAGAGTEPASPDRETVTVQRRDLHHTILATGVVKSEIGAEVKVGAQVSGVVQELYVNVGSPVRRHQILARIDPSLYRAQRDKMEALKNIAAVELAYAETDRARQKTLFGNQSISRQQYEAAEQRYELAQARLREAEAEYRYAGLQLGYTEIVSPIDGVVASVTTQKGETVAAGFVSPTFVTIVDAHRLELRVYIDETDIGRVRKGQPVSFTVDTYPGEEFRGTVEAVYPKPEIQNSVVNYITVVSIAPQKEKLLRPEMTATVHVVLQVKEKVLTLPRNAVRTEDGAAVVTVRTGRTREPRTVTVGINDGTYFEILSGVAEHEQVIVNE